MTYGKRVKFCATTSSIPHRRGHGRDIVSPTVLFLASPSLLSLGCLGEQRYLGTMKEPDPLGDFKKLFLRKKLEEIVVLPATFYFPSGIVTQLYEFCDQSGYTPGQLGIRAPNSQIYYWEKFYLYVTTPSEKPEDFSWRRIPFSASRMSQLSIFYMDSREAFTTRLLSSNKKSTRRPIGLSVLLRNQTKMIPPIDGKCFPDIEIRQTQQQTP
jgi:hypothetical protein